MILAAFSLARNTEKREGVTKLESNLLLYLFLLCEPLPVALFLQRDVQGGSHGFQNVHGLAVVVPE